MKSSHCSLIAILSIACLGVMLGAGDVVPRRAESPNAFDVRIGGRSTSLAHPSASHTRIGQPIPADAEVEVDLPAMDFIYVQLLPSDATGHVAQEVAASVIQVAIDAATRSFALPETIPTQTPLPPGHYLLSLVHKEYGQSRVLFEVR